MTRLRVALVGWGAIGHACADALGDLPIDIVAVAVNDVATARADLPNGAVLIGEPSELRGLGVDVVAEAAGRDAVEPWGTAALDASADFIVSSVSAFADPAVLNSVRGAAERSGAQLHVQPGALGGIDALAAARTMGIDTVEHRMVKPPQAWQNTPAQDLCDLDNLTKSTVFFQASAAVTADAFPKNANVAMTTALAGIGPERTQITLIADPTATTNRHEIDAAGDFGQLSVSIANNPLPSNPKTSAMAALNLARSITNRVMSIVI